MTDLDAAMLRVLEDGCIVTRPAAYTDLAAIFRAEGFSPQAALHAFDRFCMREAGGALDTEAASLAIALGLPLPRFY